MYFIILEKKTLLIYTGGGVAVTTIFSQRKRERETKRQDGLYFFLKTPVSKKNQTPTSPTLVQPPTTFTVARATIPACKASSSIHDTFVGSNYTSVGAHYDISMA